MTFPAGRCRFAAGLAVALLLACALNEARTPAPDSAAGPPAPRAPAAAATAVPREAVRVSYSSVDASQIPVWVAQDAGFFEAQGLDVELVFIESGSKALQTLLAGEAPLGAIGAAAVIAAVAGGAELAI